MTPDPVPDKLTDEEREAMVAACDRWSARPNHWAESSQLARREAQHHSRLERNGFFKGWETALGWLAARGSVSLPNEREARLERERDEALDLIENAWNEGPAFKTLRLTDWLRDRGRGPARAALSAAPSRTPNSSKSDQTVGDSAAPSTGEDEEAAVERVAKALEELLSQHEAGYTFPPPGVVGQGDVRSEAWDAARAAIAAFRGVGEAK